MCVPTSLHGRLFEICHDSPLGGHTGARKLKYEMMSQFFWPQMSSHIDKYVASCERCQRNKSYNSSTRGIPQPHAIPSRRFDVISVDLLSGFPTTKNGYDCIVVFTDRLTKRAYVSPCHKSSSAKDLTTIFMQTVFRHQGMSRDILSDNGPQFIRLYFGIRVCHGLFCLIMDPNSLMNFGNNSLHFWGLASGSLHPTIPSLMVGRRSSTRN
jgi:hypothetical protein